VIPERIIFVSRGITVYSSLQFPVTSSLLDSNILLNTLFSNISLLRSYQSISPGPRQVLMFCNKSSLYGEYLLAHRLTSKLEDHPLSAICYCLFNIFAVTLHIGGRSSIRNLRTGHAVVTATLLSRNRPSVSENTSFVFQFGTQKFKD